MMTGEQAVTTLVVYLKRYTDIPVFKFDDNHGQSKLYISVHHQNWVYGKTVNDDNIVNINIHAPKLTTGGADRTTLMDMLREVQSIIPTDTNDEESETLYIDGAHYVITSISSPVEDRSDDTYFYNVRVKVIFHK